MCAEMFSNNREFYGHNRNVTSKVYNSGVLWIAARKWVMKTELNRDIPRSFIPNEMRFNVIRITSREDSNFEGYVETLLREERLTFKNLTQLLFIMESLSDELGSPLRTRTPRSFSKAQAKRETVYSGADGKKIVASFKVCIMFRQNASWQGSCEWLETGRSANFRNE